MEAQALLLKVVQEQKMQLHTQKKFVIIWIYL